MFEEVINSLGENETDEESLLHRVLRVVQFFFFVSVISIFLNSKQPFFSVLVSDISKDTLHLQAKHKVKNGRRFYIFD
ncbi:hypothetical protein WKU26_10850 [Phocaeicola sp. HCN-40430]|uniref:hypothetical protein n=1 Tax=Phocaeicola sp. HCN-40430 TaxID=3134664 RepID=UPI0030C6101B